MKHLPGVSAPSAEVKADKAAAGPKAGWNCRPGGDGSWDCGLVGADPRGLAHPVGEGVSTANWAESTTMTPEDELRFRGVLTRMPDDPWRLTCGKPKSERTLGTQFLMTPADSLARQRAPLEIYSNDAEMISGEVSNFAGSADIAKADQRLYGDFVTHNRDSGTLNAQGNVFYREKGLSFASDSAFLRMNSDQGVLRNSQFVLETMPARGTSRLTHIDSGTLSRYETVTYTTCPPGDQDWLLHASQAKINKETGEGSARNAWMEFKGVPFFWTPYMSFPVDDRRKSGLLAPTFGYTKTSGFNFHIPYYLNLAPNYDATITPRFFANRGEAIRGEFRYLTDWTRGTLLGEYLPYDRKYGASRGEFGFTNYSTYTNNLNSQIQIYRISDQRYLNDLGNILHVPNNVYIRSFGNLNYSESGFSASALIDNYQIIDPLFPKEGNPYTRLPSVTASYAHPILDTGLMFDGRSEMVNFANNETRVTGQRVGVRPRLSYPYRSAEGFVTPSLALDHTEYWLSWPEAQRADNKDSVSRTAPVFSTDGGLYFDRDFEFGGKSMQQTLEPRLFYLYVPKVNQEDIPVFDSAQYDFNFYQLFRENRFAGRDRLGDANQLTAALTSRFIDNESGLERLRLSAGNIFYFRDREVQLPGTTAQTSKFSNIVGEAASAITDNWSVRTTGQWNPDQNKLGRAQAGIYYNNHHNDILNLTYRYLSDPNNISQVKVDQTDINFRFPIAEGWHLLGQWQYSLQFSQTTQAFFGVERETCCWRLSLIGLHYLNGATTTDAALADGQAQTNNALFFMIEFKGLTRLGDQVDNFLSRNILGYRQEGEF